MTQFRLDHRWNRTTMGDNTVAGLVTITHLQCLCKLLLCEFLLHFREDRILGLSNKTLECLLWIKTEGTSQVLFDSSKGSGALVVQIIIILANAKRPLLTCYIVMRITVNSVCHA